MLSKCLNQQCSARFRHLGNGRLFRIDFADAAKRNPWEQTAADYAQRTHAVEHFWLCGRCAATMTVVLAKNGEVQVVELPQKIRTVALASSGQRPQATGSY